LGAFDVAPSVIAATEVRDDLCYRESFPLPAPFIVKVAPGIDNAAHKKRLAANKHSNTPPDVIAITVILITLCSATDRNAGKRPAVGAACFARSPLGLDRFLDAIGPRRGGQAVAAWP